MKNRTIFTLILMMFCGSILTFGKDVQTQLALPQHVSNTNWRNELTGDWQIGFLDSYVIYDNILWDYQVTKQSRDSYTLLLTHGPQQQKVQIGKLINNQRKFTVGKTSFLCSLITKDVLPDYPMPDATPFKDNHFKAGDSVTIHGIIRNIPNEWRKHLGEFITFHIMNGVTDQQDHYPARIDSLGMFSVSIPLLNSSFCFVDFMRTNIPLECGEDYFMLMDFAKPQMLFMGKNVRVLNEIVANQLRYEFKNFKHDPFNFEKWFGEETDFFNSKMAILNKVISEHPNLSERFKLWNRENFRYEYAYNLVIPSSNNYADSARKAIDIIEREGYLTPQLPYTLVDREADIFPWYLNIWASPQQDEKLIELTPQEENKEEKEMFNKRFEILGRASKLYHNGDSISAQKLIDKNRELFDPKVVEYNYKDKDLSLTVTTIDPPDMKIYNTVLKSMMPIQKQLLDSLNIRPDLKELVLTHNAIQTMKSTASEANESMLQVINENVTEPYLLSFFNQENQRFIDYKKQIAESKSASLQDNRPLAKLTKGEDIFKNIVAPFRGKIVYIDVWGTWCGVCLNEMSYVPAMKKALENEDIVYLYLCNNSPDEAWRTNIKRFKLEGDNCIHYNLPKNQQAALEKYLNVNGYPTYHLVDRQGRLVPGNTSRPSQVEALKEEIARIK